MKHVVGIGEMTVSDSPGDIIVTHSLGSCVGLTLYDPIGRIGGMVHCMIPFSKSNEDKAKENPCMFTDTGVVALLERILHLGAEKKKLIAKVAGAAKMLDGNDHFNTAERNYTVLRKVLWKNNILIEAEQTGGNIPRTLTLYLDNGRTTVSTHRVETEF